MASPLLQALSSGFTSKQVVDYLLKKFPGHADKIKEALGYGFTADQVIQKLTNSSRKDHTTTNHATEYGKLRSTDSEARQSRQNTALSAGALAASSLAAPLAAGALQRALPSSLSGMIPTLTSQLQPKTQSLEQPLDNPPEAPAPVNPVSPNIAQTGQALQPEVKTINPFELPELSGTKNKVDELVKAGNDAGSVAGYFKKFHPKLAKYIEDKAGKDFENVISDYMGNQPKQPENMSKIPPKGETEEQFKEKTGKYKFIEQELGRVENEYGSIEKKSTVASPQGVGEVLEIRNGQAIVDVDGKKHKVPVEELESEPDEVKESKFDFNPQDIPEDLRSAPLNEVYLPYDKRHVTIKYNAGLKPVHYIYFRKDGQPIGNDYINKIVQGTQLPISSGANFWGAWDANKSDSRGSANYNELVKNAQEEGEKDDPSKEYWFIKEEALYEHPYIKKTQDILKEKEKEFNEARKKPKKKRS